MHFTLAIIVHFFVDRCIGQNVLYVGNVHQTSVDCFVLQAFREYRDDLRDHVSDNTQKTKIRNNVVTKANTII